MLGGRDRQVPHGSVRKIASVIGINRDGDSMVLNIKLRDIEFV